MEGWMDGWPRMAMAKDRWMDNWVDGLMDG